MLDQEALAVFAVFVRGFAERLLLYPGGLFALLVGLLCWGLLRLLSRWLRPVSTAPPPANRPEWAATATLALCWTGWALLPLPGAAWLPAAPDILSVLALLAGGGLLNSTTITQREAIGRCLLLAAPIVWLLAADAESVAPIVRVLAALCYIAALVATFGGRDFRSFSLAGWLEWFGWLALPLLLATASTPYLIWPVGGLTNDTLTGAVLVALLLVPGTLLAATSSAGWFGQKAWVGGGLALFAALFLLLL